MVVVLVWPLTYELKLLGWMLEFNIKAQFLNPGSHVPRWFVFVLVSFELSGYLSLFLFQLNECEMGGFI
jgi:hypothetical protein